MYHAGYEARYRRCGQKNGKKAVTVLLALIFAAVLAIGGVLAYRLAKSDQVKGKVIPSSAGSEAAEDSEDKKRRVRRRGGRKVVTLLVPVLLAGAMAIGGTLAYLTVKTEQVKGRFTVASAACAVTGNFDGITKTNVNVQNTGDIDAYVRVRLVTYRVNDQGQRIGGAAEIPAFTPGSAWVQYGDYYYYTQPVAPGEKPADDLISSMTLVEEYKDADGGKQAIDVMAEAIQSDPAKAAGEAWGVSISAGSVSAYNG